MGLQDPFARRIAQIRTFMRVPAFRVLELSRPPDLALLVQKVLARIADDPNDPHAQIYLAPTFDGYRTFFSQVIDAVATSVRESGEDLDEMGIAMPSPPALESQDDDGPEEWAQTTCAYLTAVGDGLPEEAGSLVLVLEPDDSGSREALGWSLGAFAYWIASDRVKILVVDGGEGPLVPPSEGVDPRVIRVDFAVGPEEMEREVLDELGSADLDPGRARQLQLLAGSFAASTGRFAEGEGRFRAALEGASGETSGAERANILYNLGNLYSRTERNEEASEALAQAAHEALEADSTGLAAMALANLGISLYQEGRGKEALESLKAARKLFKALDHRPGEAHVIDCAARIWMESDPERARRLWEEAASVYASIDAPHLQEVRDAGHAGVIEKLRGLPAVTGSA